MAAQRDTYGRFLFWGRERVGFVFSSVEFQSNQHLGHSFLEKKKRLFSFLFNDSVCRHLGV